MDDRRSGDAWDAALHAPERLVRGDAPSLAARLDAWVADARIEGSIDARVRERWLATAAEADATFAGVLLDLAEAGVAVTIATAAGRRLQGAVGVLGADFVALRTLAGGEVLLASTAIASVRTAPSAGTAVGERVITTDLRLGDVLSELAGDRAQVRLVLGDGTEAIAGELRAVGIDVATVRADGEQHPIAYVRIGAIAEVVLG